MATATKSGKKVSKKSSKKVVAEQGVSVVLPMIKECGNGFNRYGFEDKAEQEGKPLTNIYVSRDALGGSPESIIVTVKAAE